MALEESWNFSGRKLGVSWAVDGALVQYPPIIRGRAVVVGVRENADFPLAQYLPNSWTGYE
eukprot:scaffold31276_cov79-Cyclotella_meneghiniana.AAC.4